MASPQFNPLKHAWSREVSIKDEECPKSRKRYSVENGERDHFNTLLCLHVRISLRLWTQTSLLKAQLWLLIDTRVIAEMTHKLPPNLLALFAARPGLRYLPPNDHAAEERKTNNIGGIAQFLPALDDYKENIPYEPTESWLQKKLRLKEEKKIKIESTLKDGVERRKFAASADVMLSISSSLSPLHTREQSFS